MSDSYIQLPADGAGKKLHTRTSVIGPDTVHDQGVFTSAQPTWTAIVDNAALAANKHALSIFNGVGSGRVVKIKKLFPLNLQITAVTGALVRFDIKRSTAQAGGTAIPQVGAAVGALSPSDDLDPPLPAQILVATGATVTEGNLQYPVTLTSEEQTTAATLDKATALQNLNLIPEGSEIKEPVLREGRGITVKQITSVTAGLLSWLCVFTVE